MGVVRGFYWAIRLRVRENLSKRTYIGKIANIMDSERKIKTHEEFLRLSKAVGFRQAELARTGMKQSDARNMAANQVAAREGFKSGKDLLSQCGQICNKTQKENRNGEPREGSTRELLLQWVRENEFIPDSKALAFFYRDHKGKKVDEGTFNAARTFLRHKGWEFGRTRFGWVITRVPPQELPPQEPVAPIAPQLPVVHEAKKPDDEIAKALEDARRTIATLTAALERTKS
jgi:hypothetical protein